jgi:hypothetical protein
MAVGTKNLTLVYFGQQFVHRHFRVLANSKRFTTLNVIEIKRRRMCGIPTYNATAFSFNFVNKIAPRLLKRLR